MVILLTLIQRSTSLLLRCFLEDNLSFWHTVSLSLSHSLLHTHYLISFNRKFENLPFFTFILFTFLLISTFAFILLVVCLFSVIELRNNSKNNLHQSLLIYSSQPHTLVSEHILMILLSLSIV